MNRLTLALLAVLLFAAVPLAADQVILDRDGSSMVSVDVTASEVVVTGVLSCAPAACGDGTCDPGETQCSCATDCGSPFLSETGACSDGVDNDCDGVTDCSDSDCSADPVCGTTLAPPSTGMQGWWDWTDAHAVNCAADPTEEVCRNCTPPVGSCVHHFFDHSGQGRDVSQPELAWWPDAEADGVHFGGIDELNFTNCVNFTECTPWAWDPAPGEGWALGFAGYIHTGGYLLGYPDGVGSGYAYITIWPNGSTHYRIQTKSRTTIGSVPMDTPTLMLLQVRPDNTVSILTREACSAGWTERANGTLATIGDPAFGCFSCYFGNVDDPVNGAEGMMHIREAVAYNGGLSAADEQQLMDYLEAEHGAWVDAGCS